MVQIIKFLTVLFLLTPCAKAQDYRTVINNYGEWAPLSEDVEYDQHNHYSFDGRYSKFIIDIVELKMYFFNVNRFGIHYDFASTVILNESNNPQGIYEFNLNYREDKPRFVLGYMVYNHDRGKFTFSFYTQDVINADWVKYVRDTLNDFFYEKDLEFWPRTSQQYRTAQQAQKLGVRIFYDNSF